MRVAVVVMPSIACSGEDWSCVRSVHVNCFVLGMQTSQAQRCSCPSLARRTVTSRSWPVRLRARTAVQPQTAASAAPQAPPAGGCCIRSKVGAIAAAMLLLNPWMPDMQAYAATSATSSLDASSQVLMCPTDSSATAIVHRDSAPTTSEAASAADRGPLADLAGLFGSRDDPIDPFTLYGTNFKKYVIEQLSGEKVVSRARGFTVDTCVSAIPQAAETPEFQGLPTGDKVQAGSNLLCKRATGPDLKPACTESCSSACDAALVAYEAQVQQESGYVLEPGERARVLKNCKRACTYECTKSGKAHDFVVPYKR